MGGFGEMLPDERNHVSLDENNLDQWGIPMLHIECEHGENDLAMLDAMAMDAREILEAAGLEHIQVNSNIAPPGLLIHEMGTARMGRDPETSVVNEWGRAHDVRNLFIVDGSIFVTSGAVNPTNTIQALALYVADRIKQNLANLFD